ncbi:hypothetical protein SAMN00808754_1865 [Thermanaeromonas toyohensis ToBE]|uniref:Oxaloacetate decarboxylase, gamma chain n=1 Tax=Thermanaeromonas toyohensis ToBE TaxID=698762 RepID=A0A1W1VW64_9FIRM|nr:hypothetical protein [Thermanaeromonas toyohensis]SMB97493.1 hypothetical protein SAMN00808754_1865 [Thermanaeromonas toyohensis ToBE]
MPYAGLLTLAALVVMGILVGMWSQRRERQKGEQVEGGEEEQKFAPAGEGTVGGSRTVPSLDPQIAAVIAAAVTAASETSAFTVWTRPVTASNPWVLSGRQELQATLPLNLRWRSVR